MNKLKILLALMLFTPVAWAQSSIDDSVRLNHAYIDGVYWNPTALPGWGFFIDVQADTLFGAVYGYLGDDSTFITMQGKQSPADELLFEGDVFFVTDGGASISDVGDFSWSTQHSEAVPSASLTLTSNILNVNNLNLVRFSYVEIDKIDTISGADWNISRESSTATFGSSYALSDERMTDGDGNTFISIVENSEDDLTGRATYDPSAGGGLYSMLVDLDEEADAFYVFWASDTDMFGRYWILFPGDEPTGEGNHFRGAIDSFQSSNIGAGGGTTAGKENPEMAGSNPDPEAVSKIRSLELSLHQNSDENLTAFPAEQVQSLFEKLSRMSGSDLE